MRREEDDPQADEAVRADAAAWLARLRGPSTAEDHASFEAWYEAAPEHAQAYEAVLKTWDTAGLARLPPAGQARSALRARAIRRWRYATAAAAAAIVIAVFAFGARGTRVAPSDERSAQFASDAGAIRTIALGDGSRVTLDAASLLRTAYSTDERRVVLLRGRARFIVAHDNARPFVVRAGDGLVLAHGTVFDVAFDGSRVTVFLLQGSVEVRAAAVAGKRQASRMLAPGQSVVVDSGEVGTPSRANPAGAAWSNGMLSFEDAPLAEVIAAANGLGSATLALADPSLAKLRFTGTFKAGDNEQLARLVAATFKLELSRGEGGTLVLSAPSGNGDRKIIPG